MIDVLDTYYTWVRSQMVVNYKFGGVVQASAWPQLPAQEKTFYLIALGAQPSMGQQRGSSVSQLYEFTVQWTWFVIGTDVQANQQAMNRGDRYRTNVQMQSALIAASFPGFANKVVLSADPGNGTITSTMVVPEGGAQTIWWNKIRFQNRVDNQESGLIYTTGATELYGYETVADTLSPSIWANEGQFNTI